MQQQYSEAIAVSELRCTSKAGSHDTKIYVLPGKDGLWRRLSTASVKELDDDIGEDIQAALVRDGKIMHRIAALKVAVFKRYLKASAGDVAKLVVGAEAVATMTVGGESEETPPF